MAPGSCGGPSAGGAAGELVFDRGGGQLGPANGLAIDDDAEHFGGYSGQPASRLAQAQGVVNKIITYESTPPAPEGDDFYRHATVTSYFQPSTPCYLNAGASGTPGPWSTTSSQTVAPSRTACSSGGRPAGE